jgi:hypothetical protein
LKDVTQKVWSRLSRRIVKGAEMRKEQRRSGFKSDSRRSKRDCRIFQPLEPNRLGTAFNRVKGVFSIIPIEKRMFF